MKGELDKMSPSGGGEIKADDRNRRGKITREKNR